VPPLNEEPDFYVGYQPRATTATGTWIRRTVIVLAATVTGTALLLVAAQSLFPEAKFEYGEFHSMEGVLSESPHPSLLLPGGKHILLVAPGKHGIDSYVKGHSGASISLQGSRIGNDQMIEVDPASLAFGPVQAVDQQTASLGRVTLTGEIVDTKCHFGVMNPGSGKVHRDCAARCISGGVPPGFLVRDSLGKTHTMLISGIAGRDLLDFVAEPVTIAGELRRAGASTLVLQVSTLADIRRRE
jgi:hypothetical protein